MRSRWTALLPVFFIAALGVGCGVLGEEISHSPDVSGSVERGSDVDVSTWHRTWEQAALAEASRLHPEWHDLRARRVHLTAIGERIQVQADGGVCRMYGGEGLKGRWRANEIGPCRRP